MQQTQRVEIREQARGDIQPRLGVVPGPIVADTRPVWEVIHGELQSLATRRARQDLEIGRLLLEAERTRTFERYGYGSLQEYAGALFGFGAHHTNERLRVARALEELPRMADELRQGSRPWTAIRELTRIAEAETEIEWLDHCEGWSVGRVASMVSEHEKGDRPTDPPDPCLRRRVIRLELGPESEALYRRAVDRVRSECDPRLTEEEAVAELCRRALAGAGDEARAPYQVALVVCEHCRRTWQEAGADRIEVPAEVGDCADCDAQHIGRVDLPGDGAGDRSHVGLEGEGFGGDQSHVEPGSAGVDGDQSHVGPGSAEIDGHQSHVGPGIEGLGGDQSHEGPGIERFDGNQSHEGPGIEQFDGNQSHVGPGVEGFNGAQSHVGRHASAPLSHRSTPESGSAASPRRKAATQTVPPATRRRVLRRDGGRCRVPGCRNSRWVEIHHVRHREDGGGHEAENLVVLCSLHHRWHHSGRISIERGESGQILFLHADGTAYGQPPTPARVQSHIDALAALKSLQFRESEARERLAAARAALGPDPTVEELIRAALRTR